MAKCKVCGDEMNKPIGDRYSCTPETCADGYFEKREAYNKRLEADVGDEPYPEIDEDYP